MESNSKMKHVDLFSGIGGFALACDWAGIETVCFVEIDKFCQKVLKKHWPNVAIVEDVNNVEEIRRIVADSAIRRLQEQGLRCEDKQSASKVKGNGQIQAIITTNAELCGCLHGQPEKQPAERGQQAQPDSESGCEPSTLQQAITNTTSKGRERWGDGSGDSTRTEARLSGCNDSLLLTAGFPCQPFSNAGRKRGASDDRYLWPQTLAVIRAVKPDWIILENVAGLLNMVFPDSETRVASQASFCEVPNDEIADYNTISEGIDRDLREAGYETVWLVIPACSLGAPHRRDRVWIVANTKSRNNRQQTGKTNPTGSIKQRWESEIWVESSRQTIHASTNPSNNGCNRNDKGSDNEGQQPKNQVESGHRRTGGAKGCGGDASFGVGNNSEGERLEGHTELFQRGIPQCPESSWSENWYEVATRFCRVDARVPDRVDRLKALGNAIVPAVAHQIIKGIMNLEV